MLEPYILHFFKPVINNQNSDSKMAKNIKEQLHILIEYQENVDRAEVINEKLMEIPGLLNEIDTKVAEWEGKVSTLKESLDVEQKKYRAMDSEAKELHAKAKSKDAKLTSIKTNKEYQAVLKEIEDLKNMSSKIEDEMLKVLDIIEDMKSDLDDAKQVLDTIQEEALKEKEAIGKLESEHKKGLEGYIAKKDEIVGKIDAKLMNQYNRVKTQAFGSPIASVTNAVCNGCHMNIPPQLFNELHRWDSIKLCPNCRRIIYWKE